MQKPGIYKIDDIENGISFKMYAQTEWEHARARTFFTKEPETIEWIRRFDGTGIFWDIEANIGIYSLYCAALHLKMVIHAFEPLKSNFLRLWENIFLNDFQCRIDPHFKAVSNGNTVMQFGAENNAIGSSGGQVGAPGYPIKTVAGDLFNGIPEGFNEPKYVKIDTDGNEMDVLDGMGSLIRFVNPESVLVEINDNDDEIIKLMTETCNFEIAEDLMALKTRGKHAKNVIFTR